MPDRVAPQRIPLEARFWSKVKVSTRNACWQWQGSTGSHGYGQIWCPEVQVCRLAHRVAYELVIGAIPKGLTIDHLCGVKTCANPYHMEPVSQGENTKRALAKKTHCPFGHPLDGTKQHRGYLVRYCMECDRERHRRTTWRRRKNAHV
jgi:hypothetical protein